MIKNVNNTKKTEGKILKKLKIIAYIVLITIIVVIGVTIFIKPNKDEEENKNEKALTEIRYLDSKLEDLFNERTPLYEKYADIIINEHGYTIQQTVKLIEAKLGV